MVCFLTDDIIEHHIEEGMVNPELRDKISFVLLRKHRHQTKKPIHRSLADIGKGSSAPSELSPPPFNITFVHHTLRQQVPFSIIEGFSGVSVYENLYRIHSRWFLM